MAFSGSQVLSGTFATVKERFWSLLGMWATWFGVQVVLFMVMGGMIGMSAMAGFSGGDPNSLGAGMILGMVVFYIAYFLVQMAQNASLYAVASPLRQMAFGDAFSAGIHSALPMLGVLLLFLAAYLGGALVFSLVAAAIAAAGKGGIAVLAVLALLLIPAVIYLGCRLGVVFAVIAVERVSNPLAAIRRTWALTEGHALKIFMITVVFGLGALLVMGALFLPFFGMISAAETSGTPPNFGAIGLMMLLFMVAFVVFTLVGATLVAVMHAELAGHTGEDFEQTFG